MLARKGYSTQILRGYECNKSLTATSLTGELLDLGQRPLLLVGEGTESLVDLEVWQMLLAERYGSAPPVALVLLDCSDRVGASQSVPRSRLERLYFANRTDWPVYDVPYAWIPQERLLMLGKPTEEAWEEFSAAVDRVLSAGS